MADTPENPLANPAPWDAVSQAYTNELLPLFALFSRDALDRADLPAHPRIVDVATGPGTLALMAAEQGAQVSAIDFSQSMLAHLRRRMAATQLTGHVELHHGDGQKLPFPSATYDGAFSMFGLIFFPDRDAGFRELRRVLKPGRKAVVASWAPHEGVFRTMMDIVRQHVPGIPFGQGQAPLGQPEDYLREMKAAGFSSVTVDTVVHDREAPSVSAFWASFQRTNPPLMLLREKLGADQWKKLEPVIFSKLQQELGAGAISSRARAHLGIGVC